MHGGALVIHRAWSKAGFKMYAPLAWFVTFLYVHCAWVFFRAHSVTDATNILANMFNFKSAASTSLLDIPVTNLSMLGTVADRLLAFLPVGVAGYFVQFLAIAIAFWIISCKNSIEIVVTKNQSLKKVISMSLVMAIGMYMALHTTSTVFLYFNF